MFLGIAIGLNLWTLSLGQIEPSVWPKAKAIARLANPSEVKFAEIPSFVSTLSDSDSAVNLAALKFWRTRKQEVLEAFEDHKQDYVADHIGTPIGVEDLAIEALDKAQIEHCRTVVRMIDKLIDSSRVDISTEAMRTLLSLGVSATEIYESRIGDPKWMGHDYESHATERIKARAKSNRVATFALAHDDDPTISSNAILYLSEADKIRLHPLIRERLQSKNSEMRMVSLEFFKPVSDRELLEVVGPLLEDDAAFKWTASKKFLSSLKDPVAVFPNRMLWGAGVREALIQLIGKEGAKSRRMMIRQMLDDPALDVQRAAFKEMARPAHNPNSLTEAEIRIYYDKPGFRDLALDALSEWGITDFKERIRESLTDKDEKVRWIAAFFASDILDLSFTDGIIYAVENGIDQTYLFDWYFRNPANANRIDKWLNSKSPRLRQGVVASLDPETNRDQTLERLKRVANDPDELVMVYVIDVLSQIEGRDAATLMLEIGERSKGYQLLHLINWISDAKDARFIEFLKPHVDSKDRNIRIAARESMKSIKETLAKPPS